MQAGPTPEIESLVEAHRSYAQALAAQILRGLPPRVDRSEINAAAELGLVEAASGYDSRRGVQFKTFAYYRIRGAVYDCLRKMNWATGAARRQLVADRGTNDYLRDYTEVSTPPTDVAGAGRELERITGSVVSSYLLSLESLKFEIAATAETAEQKMQGDEQRQGLAAALAELPPNNRQVMEEYYFRDLSLEKIGEKLNLSKSWVCRMHAKSLEMLREKMQVKAKAASRSKASPAPAGGERREQLFPAKADN
jgi:RNA polymerase sigma factor for flagellar operon FliA